MALSVPMHEHDSETPCCVDEKMETMKRPKSLFANTKTATARSKRRGSKRCLPWNPTEWLRASMRHTTTNVVLASGHAYKGLCFLSGLLPLIFILPYFIPKIPTTRLMIFWSGDFQNNKDTSHVSQLPKLPNITSMCSQGRNYRYIHNHDM